MGVIQLLKSLILLFCLSSESSLASEYYIRPKAYFNSISRSWIFGKQIHIKGSRIVGIDDLKTKTTIPIVDLKDSFLLPGLIDAHSHLFFTQTKEDGSFENALKREVNLPTSFRYERARNFLKEYLSEGFTTVFDLGNSGQFQDVKLRDQVASENGFPLLLVSGPGLSNQKGQFSPDSSIEDAGKEYTLVNDSKPDWRKILESYLNHHVDILKIYFDNEPSPGGLSAEEAKQILKTAGTKFRKITAHAISSSSMAKVLSSGMNHVEHASQFVVDKRMRNSFVTMTGIDRVTLKEFNYYREPFYQFQIQVAKELIKNGNKILFGPDFYFHSDKPGFSRAKKIKQALDFFKETGLSNGEILSAMTYLPALSVKMDKEIGVIRIGALANLVVLKSDPMTNLEALKTIECVINKGYNFCPIIKDQRH